MAAGGGRVCGGSGRQFPGPVGTGATGGGGVGCGRQRSAGGSGGRRPLVPVVAVLLGGAAARVHEEVGDGRHLQSTNQSVDH